MRNVNNCCICALIYLIRFVGSIERIRNNKIMVKVRLKRKLNLNKNQKIIKTIQKIEKDSIKKC